MSWGFCRMLPMATALLATTVAAKDIKPADIRALNGDTIVAHGETYRLLGFETPDPAHAQCPGERRLGYRATFHLRQILSSGGLELVPATCNEDHPCAVLRVHGRDIADIMIADGLARSHACSAASCVSHKAWCAAASHG
jgi:endonuclease YncB( thermonuclease family)